MILFVLLGLIVGSDGPHAKSWYFQSLEACEAAKVEIVKEAISQGVNEGSFVCVKQETAKFS